jgi:uracil-DNA glycosylase family 4
LLHAARAGNLPGPLHFVTTVMPNEFDAACTDCPRLAEFLVQGRVEYPAYYCRPVPPFGDLRVRLLIVGLAPGFHGANATGRPFTGDYAGVLLYETLHAYGWSTAPQSISRDDGLRLEGCRITNAVKCVPPQNKPTPAEIRTCNRYLAAEIAGLGSGTVLLALGSIAHGAILRACGLKASAARFTHGGEYDLPRGLRLVDSYHCSRYNTNTRRLTPAMFRDVVGRATTLARS